MEEKMGINQQMGKVLEHSVGLPGASETGPMWTDGYVRLCYQTWLAQTGLGPCVHWLKRGLESTPIPRRRGSISPLTSDSLMPPIEHLLCAQP